MKRITLTARDGTELVATVHEAAEPLAIVVVASAMAVPCRLYRRLGERFAKQRLTVLRFDYRGIGENGPGTRPATASEWAESDLGGALDWADQGLPRVVLGHSFGGQALGIVEGGEALAAVYTVGSQFGYWGLWDGMAKPGMWAFWHLLLPPLTTVFGHYPAWAGMKEAIPGGVALEWARWGRSPGYLLDHVSGARERFGRITCPMRAISVSDDNFAPPRAVQALADCFPNSEVATLTPTDGPLGHFGFFKDADRIDAATQWILEQLQATTGP